MKNNKFKVFHIFPDKMTSFLAGKGIKISPAEPQNKYDKELRIAVEKKGKVEFGLKKYTTETINQGLFDAIQYMYDKEKKL